LDVIFSPLFSSDCLVSSFCDKSSATVSPSGFLGENQKDSSVIKDLSTLQKHQTENEPVSKQDKAISLKQEDKKTDIKSNLCESDNKMASVDNEASDDVSKETTQKEAKENKDDSNEKDDKKNLWPQME
jgi:hypothetical protein